MMHFLSDMTKLASTAGVTTSDTRPVHSGLVWFVIAVVILVNVNECRRRELRLITYSAEQIFKSAFDFFRGYSCFIRGLRVGVLHYVW